MISEDLIHQRFNQAFAGKLNFAAIRLPHSEEIHFLYSSVQPELSQVKYTETQAISFVCSPYAAGNLAYTLIAETYYLDNQLKLGKPIDGIDAANNPLDSTFRPNSITSKEGYEKYVQTILNAIQKNKIDKVVAARCIEIQLADSFNSAAYFNTLIKAYPHACVYYFYMYGIGCWFGASPEKLITVQKGILETVALAGTLPVDTQLDWSDKEHDEQNMTEFFIEETFKELKLMGVRKTPIITIEAGGIKHLSSTLTWKPKPEILQQKFSKLLAALNPTPAVCGLPQFEASLFISQLEQLERRFYSGFIGILLPKETQLYVNLRCMEMGQQSAYLYAGAGITEDSIPSDEWMETVKKLETLGSLLVS